MKNTNQLRHRFSRLAIVVILFAFGLVQKTWADVTVTFNEQTNTMYLIGSGTVTYQDVHKNTNWSKTTSIIFDERITEIGEEAFQYMQNLTSVTIPSSINIIGKRAFRECQSLAKINIATGTTTLQIEANAFGSSTEITFTCNRPYKLGDFTSYQQNNKWFINPNRLKQVVIGENVETIDMFSFMNCENLSVVDLSNAKNLKTIGQEAFLNCKSLERIAIPSSVTNIGISAFADCPNLSNLFIAGGNNSLDIEKFAFSNCTSLTSINIPARVNAIGGKAFYLCDGLEEITFAAGTTHTLSVGTYAFAVSDNSVGDIEFNCYRDFYTAPDNDPDMSIGPDSGYKGLFYWNRRLSKVTLGANVEKIPSYTFAYCKNLKEIDWKNATDLVTIGNYAFHSCPQLNTVIVPSSVNYIGEKAFNSNYGHLQTVVLQSQPTYCASNAVHQKTKVFTVPAFSSDMTFGEWLENYDLKDNSFNVDVKTVMIPNDEIANHNWINTNLNRLFPYLEDVIFSDNVTTIGAYICYNCWHLKSVSMPSSISSIGEYAFAGTKINEITIPYQVTEIPASLCRDCSDLDFITLSDNITTIGEYAFLRTRISSIDLPKNLTTIEEGAFFANDKVENLIIPESVKTIKALAFGGLGLSKVTIPASVTSLAYNAFEDTKIVELTINSNAVASNNYLPQKNLSTGFPYANTIILGDEVTKIGDYCFNYSDTHAVPLTSIHTQEQLTIGAYAFANQNQLKKIGDNKSVFSVSDHSFAGCKLLNEVSIINDNIIEESAFDGCSSLKNVVLPTNLTTISSKAFRGTTSLKEFSVTSELTSIATDAFINGDVNTLHIQSQSIALNNNVPYTSADNLGTIFNKVKKVIFYDNITEVGDYAFYGSQTLEEVVFKNSACTYHIYSFGNCPKLQTFTGMEITTAEGLSVKYDNKSQTLTIKNESGQPVAMSDYQFTTTQSTSPWSMFAGVVEKVVFEGNISCVGACAFKDFTHLKSIEFNCPDLKSIHNSAFYGCTSLEEIIFPETLTEIKEFAFYGNTNLSHIVLPSSLTTIDVDAFNASTNLESVICYAETLSVGNNAFDASYRQASSTTTLYVPDPTTSHPLSTYFNVKKDVNNDLSCGPNMSYYIDIEEDVILHITSNASEPISTYNYLATSDKPWKDDASEITKVIVSGKVLKLGDNLFSGLTNLTTVDLEGVVGLKTIGINTFKGCESLVSIAIPESVETISEGTFGGCSSLDDIKIPEGITTIEPYTFANTALDAVKIPSTVEVIGDFAFSNCAELRVVSFPEGLKHIGLSAFNGCKKLETIDLPDAYSIIDRYAFANSGLRSITLKSSVTEIGEHAFCDCENLEAVYVYANSKLEKIGVSAFESDTNLKTVMFGSRVREIENMAFYGCLSLKEIELPSSIEILGTSAFSDCGFVTLEIPSHFKTLNDAFSQNKSLKEIILPSDLISISSYAFYGCSALEEIILPDNLLSLGAAAFENCTQLKHIVIPERITTIENSTFANTTSIYSITLPSNLVNIEPKAFYGSSLRYLELPESIESIDSEAFSGSALTELITYSVEPPVLAANDVFDASIYNNTRVLVPNPEVYKATDIWSNFNNIKNIYSQNTANYNYTVEKIDGGYTLKIKLRERTEDTTLGDCDAENAGPWHKAYADLIPKIIKVELDENITGIGSYVFANLTGVDSIEIPASVTAIGTGAFAGCTSLKEIILNNSALTSIDVELADADVYAKAEVLVHVAADNTSILNSYKANTYWNMFEVLPFVTGYCGKEYANEAIPGSTLSFTLRGHNLHIETELSGSDFVDLEIDKVEMKDYTGSSNGRAPWWNYRTYITSVSWGYIGGMNKIGNYAFSNTKLKDITIPDGIEIIGEGEFNGCLISYVEIPNSVKMIESYAFANCTSLVNLDIPNSVTTIGQYAFRYCNSLKDFNIPNSVTSISSYLFDGCTSLETIVIPSTITNLQNKIFNGCTGLKTIQVERTTPLIPVGYTPFDGLNMTDDGKYNVTLIVPSDCLNAYSTTSPWSNFVNIQEVGVIHLVDGQPYTNPEEMDCREITYSRNFKNTVWQCLYVPFELNYNDWKNEFKVAYINNVRQYDDNEDGVVDRFTLDVIYVKDGTLLPNTPYLIKANQKVDKTFVLNDVTLYPAETEILTCSSTTAFFNFHGTYEPISGADLQNNCHTPGTDGLVRPNTTTTLKPYRWYMQTVSRDGMVTINIPEQIKIRVFEDEEDTDPIEEITVDPNFEPVYNLNGVRIGTPNNNQIIVKNHKTIILKQ